MTGAQLETDHGSRSDVKYGPRHPVTAGFLSPSEHKFAHAINTLALYGPNINAAKTEFSEYAGITWKSALYRLPFSFDFGGATHIIFAS